MFFAKKVMVCEGATEIGLMRSINAYRISKGKLSSACAGVAFADGTGNAMKYYVECFQSMGYQTALFCDSDPEGKEINELKPTFREHGVQIIDCEDGYSIEGQVFKDTPWPIVQELIIIHMQNRVAEEKSASFEQANKDVFSSINTNLNPKMQWSDNWMENESPQLRTAISKTAGDKKWFKRIDYGMQLGNCILKHYEDLAEGSRLKKEIDSISNWIDA